MEFVYDRNLIDVQESKELLALINSIGYINLTAEQKAKFNSDLKGCFNYTTINRIESNCAEIANFLGISISTKNWNTYILPKTEDFERIKNNVQQIRDSGFVYSSTPLVPSLPLNRYDKINDIEKILHDVYIIYNGNLNNLDYMGELYDTTYELYDEADYALWNNLRNAEQMDNEIYCNEQIGVI